MKAELDAIITTLSGFNPWWQSKTIGIELPKIKRNAYKQLFSWLNNPPVHRAVMLSGSRQIGKTTLMLQAIASLLDNGVPPERILYITFDHQLMKLAGIEGVIQAWHYRFPKTNELQYIFFDEIQYVEGWEVWVKHQVDFAKNLRIIFTGSAMPLTKTHKESGVGRWYTIKLTTLSFYEYLKLNNIALPHMPDLNIKSIDDMFNLQPRDLIEIASHTGSLAGYFNEFLVKGGYPQVARQDNIMIVQNILYEDIVEKILGRDLTEIFGVRRIFELENLFIYLCMHDTGIIDMNALCSNLEISRPTAQNFLDLLEAVHLIRILPKYGYGKEILRGRHKVYLADSSIPIAVLRKGISIIDDPTSLGKAAESAILKELYALESRLSSKITYYHNTKGKEIDFILETNGKVIPLEVKYRSRSVSNSEISCIEEFMSEKSLSNGFIITKLNSDYAATGGNPGIMRIPAATFCYLLGQIEGA